MLVVPGTCGNNTFTVRAAEDVSDVATTEVSALSAESEEVVEDAANEGSDTDESSDDADTEISSSASEETVTEETDSAETEEASDETEAVTDADDSTVSDSTESSTDSSSDDASTESSIEAGSDASTDASSEASSDSSSEASSDASTEASSDASAEASTEITYPEYSYSDVVDGYSISLYAPENVFPEDTTVTIERVEDVDNTDIADILAEELEDGEVVNIISFDITFYDGEEEIEPKDGSVTVEIGIAKELDETEEVDGEESTEGDIIEIDPLNAISDDAAESAEKVVRVFHISDDKTVDKIDSTVNDGNVTYDAEEFSVYSIAVITLNTDSTLVAAVERAFNSGYLDISSLDDLGYDHTTYYEDIMTAALNYADDNASSSSEYTIYVPAGSYTLSESALHIPPYTTIEMENGGVVTQTNADYNIVMSDNGNAYNNTTNAGSGYGSTYNIKIKGGTYKSSVATGVLFRFGHITGVTLENVTIIGNKNNHEVEFGAVKDITLTNCTFEGSTSYSEECVEFDTVSDSDAFPDYAPYDYYCCEDITVTGCTFKNCGCGIGSHRNVVNYFYKDITISDNIFQNLKGNAIEARGWKSSTIQNNTFDGVGCAVNTMINYKSLYKGDKYSSSGLDFTSDLTISDNTIKLNSSSSDKNVAIILSGYEIESNVNGIAKGTHTVSGLTATNNTITTGKEAAIKINYSNNDTVTNNKCYGNGNTAVAIDVYASDGSKITGNTIKNFTKSNAKGVFIREGSDKTTVSSNEIFNVGSYGVYVEAGSDTVINSNVIYKISKKAGIGINKSAKVKSINSNVIAGSSAHGVLVYNKSTVTTMKSNNISDIKKHGVLVQSKGVIKKMTSNVVDSKKTNICVEKGCKACGFSFGTGSLGLGEKVKVKKFGPKSATTNFSNSKSKVASITNGKLKGLKKGKTNLKLTTSGAKGITKVTVGSKPKSVSVSEASVTLGVNEASKITPKVNSGAGCAVYKYSSSNKGVAKVTKTGVIEAVGAGTATITVKTYNGKKTTVSVTVQ